MTLNDYIRYNKEKAQVQTEKGTLQLREKLAALLDTVMGVRRMAIATQGCKLLAIYTVDGNTGFDRLADGNCWKRKDSNSIIWQNMTTGEQGIQLLV